MPETTTATKCFLHVGCGVKNPDMVPEQFKTDEWEEIRLDIDPNVQPDIIGDITNMPAVPSNSMEVVLSSHNIEHLYPHEVGLALKEFWRVLKPGGFALIRTPDIQEVARHVANGNLEGALYQAPAGPIAAIDIMYGLRTSMEKGNLFMAHRTGFTQQTLTEKLALAGFEEIEVEADNAGIELCAIAFK